MIREILDEELTKIRRACPYNNTRLHDKYGTGRIKQENFSIEELAETIVFLGYDIHISISVRKAKEASKE